MSLKGYFEITRPVNAIAAGIAVLLGYLIAAGSLKEEVLILIPVVTLITAAGNVINDYCDREIDAINRPSRPIPSGNVTPQGALLWSAVLFVVGNLLCLGANLLCVAIAVFNSLLLVLYAARLKKIPLAGNLAVSYLAASIFLFGGARVGIPGLEAALPIALITLLAMTAREIVKDAEDIEGDREGGALTLPMILGIRHACNIALILAIAAVIVSLLPVFRWWGPLYLVAILAADCIMLAGAFRSAFCPIPECVVASRASLLLKAGMFLAVAIFLISAVIL